MRSAIVASFMACLAFALPAVAQPGTAPGAFPGEGGFVPGMAAPAAPPVRFVVSLTYAPGAEQMINSDVVKVVAFAASDPELRKRPDFQIPDTGSFSTESFHLNQATVAPVASDSSIFVGNDNAAADMSDRVAVQLLSDRADKKELVAAAARRVAESLVPSKLPKEARAKRVVELDEQLANLKDKMELLLSISRNTAELGREILKDRIKAAELERQRLEMDLVAQRVRSDAIAKQIERIAKDGEQRAQDDPVVKQLREVVKLREEERARTKQLVDAATAPMAELAAADEKVMLANIRVSEREEALRQGASAGRLERLNDELATNMINRAEMEVRLELIRHQQPGIDVTQLDEAKLNRLTDEYRALFRNPGTLPPLYFQLEKQVLELRREKLSLLVSEVKVSEAPAPTTTKAQ